MFKFLTSCFFSTLLVLGPLPSFARQAEVRSASFPDGSNIMFLCEGKSSVKILFINPEGKRYQAELFCGDIV